MYQSVSIHRLLLAVVTALFIAGAGAGIASAAEYGEVRHFGSSGKGSGQFTINSETHAFAVDPADNSVYVGDEPKKHEFRIQKFSEKGVLLASVVFKPQEGVGLGGLAIDSTLKRVYALPLYERRGPTVKEENEGVEPIDSERFVAGGIYAFSTVESGKELVPAKNEKGEAFTGGLFASPETLGAQSEAQGKALVEPTGMTVDPKTHDVIVLALQDEGEIAGEVEERVALQRVAATGALGARYVDQTNCFEGEGTIEGRDEECENNLATEPFSPVVSLTGKVYVGNSGSQIWEIPSDFSSTQSPRLLLGFANPGFQELVQFPTATRPTLGGSLSLVHENGAPESEEKLDTVAVIYQQAEDGTLGVRARGALAFALNTSATALTQDSELGWTGGQTEASGGGLCTFSPSAEPPLIAGGSGNTIFMLDLDNSNPRVVEFGPGGNGCPVAKAKPLTATVNGVATTNVPVGGKVVLSTKVTEGNVRKAKWHFEDDGTSPETGYQFETTREEHTFAKAGKYKVSETIETDNLSTPTIKQELTLNVEAAPPTAQFSVSPASAAIGQPVTFDGKNSTDPNGSAIAKWIWKFGDGTETTTVAPSSSITHAYGAAKTYTVTLEVVDGVGLRSASLTRTVTVGASVPPPEESVAPPSGPKAGPETPVNPPATNTGPTPGSGGTGKTGVLSYRVGLAASSLPVTPAGALTVKVSCSGQSSCAGTITLRTLTAVSAGGKHKAILTLASGSFTLAGGQAKALALHLSAKAKKLLAHSHVLRAQATVLARDSSGATHTTQTTVTLRLAKKR